MLDLVRQCPLSSFKLTLNVSKMTVCCHYKAYITDEKVDEWRYCMP